MLVSKNQRLVLGSPGCGKTTYLLNEVESLLAKGEAPDRIAFLSFTKKAVGEAVGRASEKFKIKSSRLPLFRTIHSLCFAGLGIGKKDIIGKDHYKELGEWLGYRFEGTWDETEGIPVGSEIGDTLLFLDNLARITNRPLKEIWEENYTQCEWAELERFQEGYQDYKSSNFVMDFTDMLYAYVAMCDPSRANYAFIDEGQDLSAAQWMVLKHAFNDVKQTTIGGDDDQAIFEWSGACVNSFLNLEGDKLVLDQSHRLPKTVFDMSQSLIGKVAKRYDKKFMPRSELGEVGYFNLLDDIEITDESTMFLVRNTHLIGRVAEALQRIGRPYIGRSGYSSIRSTHVKAIHAVEALRKNQPVLGEDAKHMFEAMRIGTYLERGAKTKILAAPDKEMLTYETLNQKYGLLDISVWYNCLQGISTDATEYYRRVLANGYSLTATPTCSVNTIHSAKGGEADHIVLLSDMANKSHKEYEKQPDSERRVAYVGITRAKKKLSILQPQTRMYFDYYNECN